MEADPLINLPPGAGEMVRRIRSHDWEKAPVGPIETRPQSLKTALDIVLAMSIPATILWGPEGVRFYNDAYVAVARDRHPALLGRPVAEGWPDAYEAVIAPLMDAARAGRATRLADFPVTLRGPDGKPEERVFDTDWLPLRDESGAVAGALQKLVEVTDRHQADRALRESEELRRIALQSGGMGAWSWDARDRRVRADEFFQKLWGVSFFDQRHLVSTYTERMYPEGAAALEAVMAKEIAPEEEFQDRVQVESRVRQHLAHRLDETFNRVRLREPTNRHRRPGSSNVLRVLVTRGK